MTYDLVVVGSGFGSLFFVKKYLENEPKTKIAIIEWGSFRDSQTGGKSQYQYPFSTSA